MICISPRRLQDLYLGILFELLNDIARLVDEYFCHCA